MCRELSLPVTLTERSAAPLGGALGAAAGAVAARLQREYGVDLRCHTTVLALEGDEGGRLRRARLSDGDALDVDVAVVALGAHPQHRVAAWRGARGRRPGRDLRRCLAGPSTPTAWSRTTSSSPGTWRAGRTRSTMGSSSRSSTGATPSSRPDRRPQHGLRPVRAPRPQAPARVLVQPVRRKYQVLGLPTVADEVVVMQGSVEERRFVAVYGRERTHGRRGRGGRAQVAGGLRGHDRRPRAVPACP